MNEMNITLAKYIAPITGEPNTILAVIDGNNTSVPMNPDNRHYAALLEWAEQDGNIIQEAD